jgi:hypothetical protein
MKTFARFVLVTVLFVSASADIAAQPRGPSPKGISTLLCTADALLGGVELETQGQSFFLFGKQVGVTAESDAICNGSCIITVRIHHGVSSGFSSSVHTIEFLDSDNTGGLTCDDEIINVV